MWLPAVVRALVAGISYALGAARDLYPNDPWFRLCLSVGIGVLAVLVVFVVEYRTSVRPALHVAKARAATLRALALPLLRDLRGKNFIVRMNLMVPFRPARWLWTRRFFRIVWSDGMEDQPDVNFQPPIGYLVVGECFRMRAPIFASRRELERQRVPRRLRGKVPGDLEVICSYPVYEPPRGHEQQSGRVVAVLNLDAKTPGLFQTSDPPSVPAVLDQKMRELAKVAGYLVY
jgi:hypothetical protein